MVQRHGSMLIVFTIKKLIIVRLEKKKSISVPWVCLVKQIDKESKPKARLVVRGFDEDSLNTFDKESPTVSRDT